MRFRTALLLLLALPAFSNAEDDPPAIPKDHVKRAKEGLALFKQHVGPALKKHCLDCHGGKSTKADFNLATRKLLLESGFVEKTAADSHLMSLVRHQEKPHMPFKKPKLDEGVIGKIARWIDLGAPYDKPLAELSDQKPELKVTAEDRQFWSFQTLHKPTPPTVSGEDAWSRTPIDRFVLKKLRQSKLQPNSEATRRTLIRRVTLDLIGLPPSSEEVEQFVADEDPEAYEKLVERLLKSPRYGERWARHWLDVARFAESSGFEHDSDRPHAWRYRDFVIKALNDDLPYDQFVLWQLAGDELPEENAQAMAATGFLGAGVFPTQLTETEFESARYDEMDDMLTTTGVAFLGLSIGCARCHDHKFDPIPTRDYYRLVSTFTKTIRSEVEVTVDGAKTKVLVAADGFPKIKHHADGRGYPHFYKQTHFLKRGDVNQKQEVVEPGYLQVLMSAKKTEAHWRVAPPKDWTRSNYRRTSLANWITDVEYGAGRLAARVIVNRLWQHHFGRGLVATPNDFGLQGETPTHPELLDWLANDLVSHGWRLKRLHKLMLTSSAYRQSGEFDPARAKLDPQNRLLWRWSTRRLDAEVIRDSALHVSGLLDTTMYGPGSLKEDMPRRSVYFTIKRSRLIPSMMLLDWPEHLVSIGRRGTTTTATQALMFINNPHGRKYAQAFADRLQKENPDKDAETIVKRACLRALGREPDQQSREALLAFLARQTKDYREQKKSNAERIALTDLCQAIMGLNAFVYVD